MRQNQNKYEGNYLLDFWRCPHNCIHKISHGMKLKTLTIIFIGLIMSACTNEADQLIEDYGVFINNVEAEYEDYSDKEWAEALSEYENFKVYPEENSIELSQRQMDRMDEYTSRFKKIQMKRDPLNHVLDIIMN